MKCSACAQNLCEGKYEKRSKCTGAKEKINCTCICHNTEADNLLASVATAGTGAAAVGYGLSIAAGGFLAAISGAAILGAGASLIFLSIQKRITRECVTVESTIKEAALGATIGAITGPIGAIGSTARTTSTVAKVGIRALAGSGAGAVSGAIVEGSRAMKGEEVSVDSFVKSMAIGAVVGSVGGASSQVASSVSTKASSQIGRAATRIAVQGTTAAATDASIQLCQNGKIDPEQLFLNTTGQLTVATAAEVGSSYAQRTNGFNKKVNNDRIKNSNLSTEDAQKVKSIINEANALNKNGELKGYKRVGENNIHNLGRDRAGQIAADIKPQPDTIRRGPERVILEKFNNKYVYVDHTMDHKYKNCAPTIKNQIPNPVDQMLRTDQINVNLLVNKDDFDEMDGAFDESHHYKKKI